MASASCEGDATSTARSGAKGIGFVRSVMKTRFSAA